MELKELNKRIDDLNKKASDLTGEYQAIGLLVLEHVQKHGDVGPANRLYLGMPKSVRRLAMGQWLVKFGKMKPNADRNSMKAMPIVFDKAKEGDMEGAKAKQWWEMAPEKEITDVIDLQVAVKSLLSRCKDKRIMVGGKAMSPEAAQSALRTISLMVGLPVDPVTVSEDGKAHVGDASKVGDTPGAGTVPPADAITKAADAAAKAVEAAKSDKAGAHQGEKDMVTAAKGRTKAKDEKANASKAKRKSAAHAS